MQNEYRPTAQTTVRAVFDVGYCKPPVHSRFQPGQSGNPSGRTKGSKNLKTLFLKILNEQVSLREGAGHKKVSKAEVIVRSLVVGAMKGDSRSVATLLRMAEQTGQLGEAPETAGLQVIVNRFSPD